MKPFGLPARIRALVLASLVLGGWFGLPAADALLYHSRASANEHADSVIGGAGEAQGHWLRCTLGADYATPRFTAPVPVLSPVALPTRDCRLLIPREVPRQQTRAGLPQERSPPTPA